MWFVNSAFRERRGNLPAFPDAVLLEPVRYALLAIAQFQGVPRRFRLGNEFFPGVQLKFKQRVSLLFRRSVFQQTQAHFANILKRTHQALCRADCGCSGIVQFVCEAGGQFAERHQFFLLRFRARHFSDAVGHQSDQSLGEQRHALDQLREILSMQTNHPRMHHGAAQAFDLHRRQHDVVKHGLIREEVEALKDHTDFRALPSHHPVTFFFEAAVRELAVPDQVAVHLDATGVDLLEMIEATQERRLAPTRRPHDDNDLARPHGDRDAPQHFEGAETFVDVLGLDRRRIRVLGHHCPARGAPSPPMKARRRKPGRAAISVSIRSPKRASIRA